MTQPPPVIQRRDFIRAAGLIAAGSLVNCNRAGGAPISPNMSDPVTLRSRPGKRTEEARSGLQPLRLGSGRDGFLYVPPAYSVDRPAPLLVILHGAGHDSREWSSGPLATLFDPGGIVVVGPDSRGATWDVAFGEFGPDVKFIDSALDLAFRHCSIDPHRIAIGGFSDGASYALSLGITNGDLFSALLAFSPGFVRAAAPRGKPRIFVAHGRQDKVLPIETSSRVIVPRLEAQGYDVTYREFDGPHMVTVAEAVDAMRWFVP